MNFVSEYFDSKIKMVNGKIDQSVYRTVRPIAGSLRVTKEDNNHPMNRMNRILLCGMLLCLFRKTAGWLATVAILMAALVWDKCCNN